MKLEIDNYYELVALHKALRTAKFARTPMIPALAGSPYLADIARRVVETLAEMEKERGMPERAKDWLLQIDPQGEVWEIAVNNATREPDSWKRLSIDQKTDLAKIHLSPFEFTEELVQEFVRTADEKVIK